MLQALSAMHAEEETRVGNYRFLTTIGKGGFSQVKLARHLPTSREVAVKITRKSKADSTSLRLLSREVSILKTLRHPNVIQLFEVIEHDESLYLCMEYAKGGDLFDYLEDQGPLGEREARAKFRQMLSAIYYCHRKGIAHRDLKPENLLLDASGNIKVADFGLSSPFSSGQMLATLCGSIPYVAPEILLGRNYDGPATDVWSLGVILYTMVSGDEPFDANSFRDLRDKVLTWQFCVPSYLSVDCAILIKKCLMVDASKRATLQNLITDRWVNLGYKEALTPYVEPLPDCEDVRRTARLLSMGYSTDKIRESLSKEQYDEIMGTYLLLGSQGQEDSAITLQPQPSPVQKCSRSPSPNHEEHQGVSAEHMQHRYSEPVILPSYSFLKKGQEDMQFESRRKAWSTANIPASPLPGQDGGKPTTVSPRSGQPCALHPVERIRLEQAVIHEVSERPKVAEAGAFRTSAASVEGLFPLPLPQEPLMDTVQPSPASGLSPRENPSEGPQPSTGPQLGPVASPSAHSSCSGEGHPERTSSPRGVPWGNSVSVGQRHLGEQQNVPCEARPASPCGDKQGRRGAMRKFLQCICRGACLGCARGKQERGERKYQKERFCQEDQPRSRYFKLGMKIMSSLDPQEMLGEICRVLDALGCEWDLTGSYRLLCMCGTPGQEDFVQWRVEVCRLPWRGLHGVQVRKMSGTSRAFKNIAANLEKWLQV
ncbi:serine/threonine-protein kinase MARK2-like [Choloepus didactylus]|uniref:serine/threonine-protein kinase MARK2-like n=1 Tax=Choloepus didactylus TaxID=27675 RepID=UPI00189E205A|nr:serine/threonine-protein kinase MARK2-like [Choloepus didactylus]